MQKALEQAVAILNDQNPCNRCLGRCFARLGTGLGNDERGRALRIVAEMTTGKSVAEPEICCICNNIFTSVDFWAKRAVEASNNVEFRTYLVGTTPPSAVVKAENDLREANWVANETAEPFKQEFNRETGKKFESLIRDRVEGATADLKLPDITFKIDLEHDRLKLEIRSLYIYGRYGKLVRHIPQTQWPCKECKGHGCQRCGQSGKQYPESVGELIARPVLERAIGTDHAFHGAGREDVDALMLGAGRPFVLEIKQPKIRSLDLGRLSEEINRSAHGKVEVGQLKFVNHKLVEEIKNKRARKSYAARIELTEERSQEQLTHAVEQLIGDIEQKTPTRVLHRRADLIRHRVLFEMSGRMTGPTTGEVELTCDGGLYVKELISGDHGRTLPSLTALLATACIVTELDVTDVDGDFPD